MEKSSCIISYRKCFTFISRILASNVDIFFRDPYVIVEKRIEMYSYTNFLAICGGLLGLYLGISTLSIVEFVYYLTLRLYWSLQRWKCDKIINVQPIKKSGTTIGITKSGTSQEINKIFSDFTNDKK